MAVPKSTDVKINKISQALMGFAKREDLVFCYQGNELNMDEVFNSSGFLTLFLADAKELYEKVANGLYTHKELMETINGNNAKAKKAKKMTPEQYQMEEEYLSSQSIAFRYPVLFVQKEKTFVSAVPFVDPKKKVALMTLTGFAVESLLEYAKTYKNDKSLLIDGMIPIEPLFNKVSLSIGDKKIKIYPQTMLAELENHANEAPSVPLPEEKKILEKVTAKAKELPTETLSEADKAFESQIDSLFS